ncbi:MAG TPA: DUF4149 domain-containing protein [Bradyrhizobium sp.]|nr:DUF4149 domain-containing protein [Bradyrhizobium sp.]
MAQLSAILSAMSLGAMLFFSAVVAPTLFKVLPADGAGSFLRALFPKYFIVNGVLAGVAALLAYRWAASLILIACAAAMLGVAVWMIPIINAARDRMISGRAGAKTEFDKWHRASVLINMLEMVGLACAIVQLLRGA